MSKSSYKLAFVSKKFFSIDENVDKAIYLKSKNSLINYKLLGRAVYLHNGKDFIKLHVLPAMEGYRLGMFVTCRKKPKRPEKISKKGRKK